MTNSNFKKNQALILFRKIRTIISSKQDFKWLKSQIAWQYRPKLIWIWFVAPLDDKMIGANAMQNFKVGFNQRYDWALRLLFSLKGRKLYGQVKEKTIFTA